MSTEMRDYLEQREKKLEADIAKLNAALEKIVAESHPDTSYSWGLVHLKRCNEIAREALGLDEPVKAFEIGSIVRTGAGPTALMEITTFSGGRAYGDHVMGGSAGAEICDLREPSDEDMRTWWKACASKNDI